MTCYESSTPNYDALHQFLPIENLSPKDRVAVLQEMARSAVRIVSIDGTTSRHYVLERLQTDFGYLPSDAGAAILYATDSGLLLDEGIPSQLILPGATNM